METQDVRWIQRFNNFAKALAYLEENGHTFDSSSKNMDSTIHRFEMVMELGWKLLQDYLKHLGYQDVNGPKPSIERAYREGIITDGEAWFNMYNLRNLTTHTYSADMATSVYSDIFYKYIHLLSSFKDDFEARFLPPQA